MARYTKEITEARNLLQGKMPVNIHGVTILVPQHEIERLVKEYAISKITNENGGN